MRKALMVLLLAAFGCGDSGTEPKERSIVGTYALVAVDGNPLPYEVFGSEIRSGSVALRSNNTFTLTTVYDDGTETETGTYTHSGNQLTFTTSEGSAPATYDGTTIEVDAAVVVLTYRRQ